MNNIIKYLKNPPQKYRPLPFWSWNAKLECDESRFQIDQMNEKGMGGFFMHARGGLKTRYLGKEWMDNIKASIDRAKKYGMYAWGYDENGWPSGFGSDAVNGLGLKYQQKYLRMELSDEPKITDFTICNTTTENGKNAHFYYDVNRFYVDTLDAQVTDEFIRVTHEKYKEVLGEDFTNMAGFFTDEPQISRNGYPWSLTLPQKYNETYGEDLLAVLYDLFADTETCYQTRFKFWKLVTRLFCENFMGRIYDWCNKNGSLLTGHMVLEECFVPQIESNGACMPNYEYLHIPGVDKLGRAVDRNLHAPQVTSVAAQLGKKQVLTESFALCGWDVSFEELKWILEWQMVKGVNLLCHHLAGYSLEGIRKRDYPSGHFYQNPWWNDYKDFNDFASRMGMLLSEGQIKCDVLVLHTISSGWVNYGLEGWQDKVQQYNNKLTDITTLLDKNQINYHLGDDRIMSRYAKVTGKKIDVGQMSYSTVIVPASIVMDGNTFSLISEFAKAGGNLIFTEEVPTYIDGVKCENASKLNAHYLDSIDKLLSVIPVDAKYASVTSPLGENCDIQVAYRKFDDFEMYYFVNTFGDQYKDAKITVKGKSAQAFDYMTGETVEIEYTSQGDCLNVVTTFEKMGSFVLFVYNDSRAKSKEKCEKQLTSINDLLKGEWKLAEHDENVVTLDFCDCYFDGELVEKNVYVNDIQEKACALGRKVEIRLDYFVDVKDLPENTLYLVTEQPDNYTFEINGKVVAKKKCGYYRDKSFIKLDITGILVKGNNTITAKCNFVQSKEVYDQLENCLKFESMKNKLWYDMEIEPIYLLGDFAVNFDKDFTPTPGNGLNNAGKYTLTKLPETFNDGDLTEQGLPFFCGHIKLKKDITVTKDRIENASIELARRCSAVSRFTVNGKKLDNLYWAPYIADLSGLINEGKNEIQLDITGNFRNMLGPHHMKYECYWVGPNSFMHNSPIFGSCGNDWTDSYTFVKYGLFLK